MRNKANLSQEHISAKERGEGGEICETLDGKET
jgi:hypothetical protein